MDFVFIIIFNVILILIAYFYARSIIKLSGYQNKDEMYRFFYGNTFKKIGIILMVIIGISLFINLVILNTYHGNIPKETLLVAIKHDAKYLIIATITYLYHLIKLKHTINSSDK
ncbi:hypothetical protein HZY91_02720 [Facklamia sp. DSM 111018]|uniref:Uncharacterized protein n=1 Tax=Facklamia lactis TaxID=2749967 RepID=A0ABS0LNR2_9LACT|nr:hypothetical protein [Facklamia lactis]MBG9985803.1 hypothetical protein [Facklamia lactis]